MLQLTDLCKNDFITWYRNRLSVMSFGELLNINDKTIFYSMIIEFFDSVGYHFNIYPHLGGGQVVYYSSFVYLDENNYPNGRDTIFDDETPFYALTRQEATTELIKKANEFYNEKNIK